MNPPHVSPLAVFFGAIFTENILLALYLGMCSYLAISRDVRPAVGLGAAVTLVLAISSGINNLLYWRILHPFGLEHLQFISFMLVIAAVVQCLEMIIERYTPRLHLALGIYLPLITVNCAILGVCLFMVIRRYDLVQSVAYGAGGGIGWWLAIVALAGIRQRLQTSRIPRGLQGPGIALIASGIMALAFMGLTGIIRTR